MSKSYWTTMLDQRVRRRRAIVASGAVGLGAALLAACGGGDSSTSSQTQAQTSSLITNIADTTAQAKPGGVYQQSYTMDIASWDPFVNAAWWALTGGLVFSRLTMINPGKSQPSDGEVIGDAAESWEFAPDGLTLTFKMRPNLFWHPVAPVNGRQMDMQDILFTWNRFTQKGVYRSDFANSVDPNGPISSVTAPDDKTIVMKLAFPMATLPAALADQFGGYPQLLPREADGQFDPRTNPIGSGPFYLAEQVPSSHFLVKRNPKFYDPGRPYVDAIDTAIITEYATGLSQFKAGHLHKFTVKPPDVLQTKQDVPQLVLNQTPVAVQSSHFFFGWRPDDKNPFRDVRVRQAFSEALDRDAYIEVFYNVSKFQQEGIPTETRWNTALAADFFKGWWLDPKSNDFGPNAQYFAHNVADAKKLMTAAGFANGLDVIMNSAQGYQDPTQIQVAEGMAADAGFRFSENVVDYNSVWNTDKFRYARGNFDGLGLTPTVGGDLDAVERFRYVYSAKSGVNFKGIDVNGKGDMSGDPYVEGQLQQARTSLDVEKRRSIVLDLQKYLAKQQYIILQPGGASGLSLTWPMVKNYLVFQGPSASYRNSAYEWLDPSQPPGA